MKSIKNLIFTTILICLFSFLVSCTKTTYTINFMVDDKIFYTTTVEEESLLELPTEPTKEQHKFVGWYDEDGNAIEKGISITQNMNLKALFEINKYAVIFDYNDGSEKKESTDYAYGSKIDRPKDPTKTGYTFLGWYLGDEKFDFSNVIEEDITLTAKWSLDETVISFNSNGGTTVIQIIALPGSKIEAPKNPTKKGCTFLGWYLNDVLYEFDTMPSESITLEAKWESRTYTISYDLHGGTGDNLLTSYSSDRSGIIDLPRPTKEGYSFMGWYSNEKYNRDPVLAIGENMNKNLTLHAKWVETKTKEVKTIGIYGDSISTFEGYVPTDALFFYPTASRTVKTAEKTWWRLLQHKVGLEIITNASYSTSPVCGSSSICGVNGARIRKLISSQGEAPDIIIIMMGANDVVNGVTPEKFEEQYCLMLDRMKDICPDSDVIICNILYNTCTEGQNPDSKYDAYTHPGLRAKLNDVLAKIAEKYNYPLVDISKLITEETDTPNNWYYLDDNMHPSDKGMELIAEEIAQRILEIY